jgi:hypothetical protein
VSCLDLPSLPPRLKTTRPRRGGWAAKSDQEARRDQAHLQGCNAVKDPERVAPEPGGPSRKRRPSPSSGTATNTPAHPRRPPSVAHRCKTIAAQRQTKKRHPCTVRRRRAVWRQAERRPGRRANGAAPPVEANAQPPPDRQGERHECQRVSA